jgi:hypothetical protein
MPLVDRPRTSPPQRAAASSDLHWGMLAFESISAGAMAVLIGFLMVLVVVGLYVMIVWPLTFWDLANSGLEQFSDLAKLIVWSVFAGGTLAGYWCFSGKAFKPKAKAKPPVRNMRPVKR